MIPANQTTFGSPGGNCFSACVASLLEIPTDDVPYFMGDEFWWDRFVEWCAERAIRPVFHDRREGRYGHGFPPPAGYSIKTGQSPRYPPGHYHSVVALDGETVHDPRADDPRGVWDPVIDYITLEVES